MMGSFQFPFIFFAFLASVKGVDFSFSHGVGGPGWIGGGGEDVSPARDQLVSWSANTSVYGGPATATTLNGAPIPSLSASQAIGTRGHILLQDYFLIDKLAGFNRERIPERTVHAKGAGAHGHFVVTNDVSHITKAKVFNGIGKITPTFTRFSTVGGELGSSDTVVDPHGFATKFYTEEGNYDLVGNDIEVFNIRDPMLFPDMARSRKRNPKTHLKSQDMWWDFASLRPETTFQALIMFSDIGRAHGYRRMNGSSVHAMKMVNARGEVVFAKLHWRTQQPAPAMTFQEAKDLLGTQPEYFTQDLYDNIEKGNFPSWKLYFQVMTVEQANAYPRNPFDPTRNWRVEDYPLIEVGRLTMDRNPVNFFAEVEQVGFSVANLVPGIEPSPDRILHGRMFGYADAIIYRLGANWPQLPINRPREGLQINSYQRDGAACYGDNGGGAPNYWPNSFGGHQASTGAAQVGFNVDGVVDRFDIPEDEFIEARWFLERDMDAGERQRTVESIADRLKDAREEIRERALRNNFYPIDHEFGEEIRKEVERALRRVENERNRGK
ncbi:unnamed protein product [Orchesella dallaii]|uniref:Catalase core domain-containing protein n=1 Tax=Orchesella dallaii TaxID=48710 RepID=A0ABP1S7Z3_9HEXA